MTQLTAIDQRLRTLSAATVLAIVCLSAGNAAAQPMEADGSAVGQQRRGPPPEALAACKSLTAGQACSVTMGSNTIKGTCWAPEGKPLACRPAGATGPEGGKPSANGK
jgi:hypothetical protein